MSDQIQDEVTKRAELILGQQEKVTSSEAEIPEDYVLDCLYKNRVGDANLFASLFRNKYIFIREWDRWLYYNQYYWCENGEGKACADLEKICELYTKSTASKIDDEETSTKKLLSSRLNLLRDPSGQDKILKAATRISEPMVISSAELDKQPYLLATPTGIVDLRTGEASQGNPKQYIYNYCQTDWTGIDTPCPEFDNYLLTCMDGDQEMVEFIVRLLGYSLLGVRPYHVWAIFYGPLSRNGKDTLMNVIKEILGNKLHVRINVQMLMEQKFARNSSQPEPDIMALRGAKIAYTSEASASMKLDQNKIKDLVGGGYITARSLTDKYMTEWKQSALLLMLTNFLPKLESNDDGFRERTYVIEWPVKFVAKPEKSYERQIDYTMYDKLITEKSGILARLVRACMDVLVDGLNVPEKVLTYTKNQFNDFDDIGKFLRECCILEETPTGGRTYETEIVTSELLRICNWWCKTELGNAYPFSPKKFTQSLAKKGINIRKSGVQYYQGVQVRDEILEQYHQFEGKK